MQRVAILKYKKRERTSQEAFRSFNQQFDIKRIYEEPITKYNKNKIRFVEEFYNKDRKNEYMNVGKN